MIPNHSDISNKEKVVLDTHFRHVSETFSPEDLSRLYSMAEIVWGRDEQMPLDAIEECREEVSVIISANWRHGDVRRFPKLRAILEVSGRFPDIDTLDYNACFEKGIRVLSCAPSFAPAVSEMALGLALAAARGIASGDESLRAGNESWFLAGNSSTFTLFDQPVGIIGFGSIARTLRPLLAPFRCPIKVYDPWLTPGYIRTHEVEPADLDTVLRTSQIIFVLAAPTEKNEAMISREKLELMQQGALMVLVSRAHVVDFEALTELLYAGRIRAAIDVFPQEPLPLDHPIRKAPNTVLSAHRAGGFGSGYTFIGKMVTDDTEAILSGFPPQQMQSAQPESIRGRGAVRK